ncbi:MAG: hypothetical protein JKY48_15840 [Flavobacteriales bacterium]|nr:hypothetical protein [Flavobacteriales bacterium]
MKDNNNLDELFRKGTEHHYPFDESLWATVEGQLPPQQTKPLLWIFNLNSVALVFMLFVCAIIPTDNTRADKRSTLVASNNSETIKPSISDKKNLITSPSTPISSQESEPAIEKITPKNNVVDKSKKKTLSSSKTTLKESDTNNSNIKSEQSTHSSLDKVSINSSFTAIGIKPKKEKQLFNPSLTLNQNLRDKSDISFYGHGKKRKRLGQELDFIHPLGFESLHSASLLGTPLAGENKRAMISSKSYYLELEISQDISIEKTLMSSNQDLQKLKQDNEKSLSQTLIGLNLIRQKKSFIYGIGLHHSKYTERVSYIVDKESLGFDISYDTTYQLISGNFNSNGTPVFLINQEINELRNPTTIIIDDKIFSINTFKRIGIPVFIGVQQDYKNWIAELRTSLSFNYLYQSQGIYLADDLDQIESISSGAQLESMVIGNKNDLSLGYSFHEQFAIGARYSLYNDLSSFTSGYESRIRTQSVGVWILWKPE